MIDFILQSRIKYFVLFVLGIILLVFILHTRNKVSEEDEIRNFHEEIAIRGSFAKTRQKQDQPENKNGDNKPNDWNVQFYSGKQMADEVDHEKQMFQVHTVIIENVATQDVDVECRDVFSKFGAKLPPGSQYKFQVTDLFHKRHYWCEAIYDSMSHKSKLNPKFRGKHRLVNVDEADEGGTDQKKSFIFKAYGEGAPRDNNHVSLKLEGAFINGENMVFSKEN